MGICKNHTSHARPIDPRVYKQECTQTRQTQHTALLNDVDLSKNKTKYRCSRLERTNDVLEMLKHLSTKVIPLFPSHILPKGLLIKKKIFMLFFVSGQTGRERHLRQILTNCFQHIENAEEQRRIRQCCKQLLYFHLSRFFHHWRPL